MSDQPINTHDQLVRAREAGLSDVGILTRHVQGPRDSWRDGWKVYRPGYNIGDVSNRWDWDYGCRVFSRREWSGGWRKEDAQALEAAKVWASKRYGITEWARNKSGDWVDARVNKQFPLRGGKG